MPEILNTNAILILWILWGLYWQFAARGVKRAQRTESIGSRLAHVLPLLIGVLLIALPTIPGRLGQQMWMRSWNLYWVEVGIVALGLGFACWARRELGRNWSGTVTLKEQHELIRTGPYRWIRHPIYTGILLGVIGTAMARDHWGSVLGVLIVIAALWRKLRVEERWMRELFGAQYDEYCRHSWALIPWVL